MKGSNQCPVAEMRCCSALLNPAPPGIAPAVHLGLLIETDGIIVTIEALNWQVSNM